MLEAMNVTLLKSLVALVPTLMLLSRTVFHIRGQRLCPLLHSYSAQRASYSSFSLTSAKHSTCSLQWVGGRTTALVSTSTCGAPFLVSRCFRWATYFMRLAGSAWPDHAFNRTPADPGLLLGERPVAAGRLTWYL